MEILLILILAFLALGTVLGQEASLPPDPELSGELDAAFARLRRKYLATEALIAVEGNSQEFPSDDLTVLAAEARRLLDQVLAKAAPLDAQRSALNSRGDARVLLRRLSELEDEVVLAHSLVSSERLD